MRTASRVIVLMMLFSPIPLFATDPGPALAALYVDAAREAYAGRAYDRSRTLVDVAEQFTPSASDALILDAMLLAQSGAPIQSAVERATRALDSGSWDRFPAAFGTWVLARLYNHEGKWGEAERVVADRRDGPGDDRDFPTLSADLQYERLRALYSLGSYAEVADGVRSARDSWPNDPRFFWFTLLREPNPSLEYRQECERLIAADTPTVRELALFGQDPGIDDLLYLYASRTTATERAWARGALLDLHWADARLALLFAGDEPQRALDLFEQSNGFSDATTFAALRGVLPQDQRAKLLTDASGYTGTSLADPDADGVWNERLTVRNGSVTRWERDRDQDGLVELAVDLAARPVSVTLRDPGRSVTIEYGQYPFIATGTIEDGDGTRVVTVRPRSVRLDSVERLEAGGPGFATSIQISDARRVQPSELLAAAIAIDTLASDGSVSRRVTYSDGVANGLLEDENGDGGWDHLVVFRDGEPAEGIRDLDSDGYFEVAEGYRSGELVVLAVDSNDDGVPELYERTDDSQEREWDVNGDGKIDVREFGSWTDSVRREFPFADR